MRTYIIKRFDGNWDNIEYLQVDNILWLEDCGVRTKMKIAYDDEKMYLHMISKEENIRHEQKGDLARVCTDSCMEFFFGPKDDTRYFNFEANFDCFFHIGFGYGRSTSVRLINHDLKFLNARSSKTNNGWQLNYEIPFCYIQMFIPEFKPIKGYKLKANCFKCGDDCVKPHYLAWNDEANATPDFHRPEYFGEMIFD